MRHARIVSLGVLLALFAGAALQGQELLSLFGVKPNLVLVMLAVLVFFIPSLLWYGLYAICAALFLDFAPGISRESVALVLVALTLFYIRMRFVNAGAFTAGMFAVVGTTLFYLLISPGFLYDGVRVAATEITYNAILAALFFTISYRIYEKEGGPSIR